MDTGRQWIVLARIDRSRGRRGEVLATSFTEVSRIPRDSPVFLVCGDAPPEPAAVEEVWEHQGRLVIKMSGVNSIGDAERLRGCEICVTPESRPPAPAGSYHLADLVGCRIEDKETEEVLGVVEGWQEAGGPLLLEVRSPSGAEWLLPFAASICVDIQPAERRIAVRLPEGLQDLNP